MWCVGVNIYFSKRHRVVGTFLTYLLRVLARYTVHRSTGYIFGLQRPSRRAADALKMIEQQRTVPSALLVLAAALTPQIYPPHAM